MIKKILKLFNFKFCIYYRKHWTSNTDLPFLNTANSIDVDTLILIRNQLVYR